MKIVLLFLISIVPALAQRSGYELLASDYNFRSQTLGIPISIGSNTITISPVPLGINGTDIGHQVYITGGVGTAEACLITGGTAVSGGVSGTVIITCSNTHTGASIQSATNGGQEAIQILQSAGKGGEVKYGQGSFSNCGTITVSTPGITISGIGSGGNGTRNGSP